MTREEHDKKLEEAAESLRWDFALSTENRATILAALHRASDAGLAMAATWVAENWALVDKQTQSLLLALKTPGAGETQSASGTAETQSAPGAGETA